MLGPREPANKEEQSIEKARNKEKNSRSRRGAPFKHMHVWGSRQAQYSKALVRLGRKRRGRGEKKTEERKKRDNIMKSMQDSLSGVC